MRRRLVGLLVALTLSILTVPLRGTAQAPAKVYRIGMLRPGSPPAGSSPNFEAFRQGMHNLGYIEGQHFVVESRWAEGSDERLHELAAELVRLQVDVIMAAGAVATHAAQQATRTMPIVMLGVYDPVGAGLVASLAHPGGNITGVSTLGLELAGKRLELLKETVPQLGRVAVLANPTAPPHTAFLETLTVVSQELGLQLQVLEVHSPDELDRAFTALPQTGVEALFVLPDPPMLDRLDRRIADLAAQHRLPAIYPFKSLILSDFVVHSLRPPMEEALSRLWSQLGGYAKPLRSWNGERRVGSSRRARAP